jgi:hypothetical protein
MSWGSLPTAPRRGSTKETDGNVPAAASVKYCATGEVLLVGQRVVEEDADAGQVEVVVPPRDPVRVEPLHDVAVGRSRRGERVDRR